MGLLLPTTTITAPTSYAGTPNGVGKWWQYKDAPQLLHLNCQALFSYGSSGATVDAYLQTSFDGGTTAIDIANFHFTTGSKRSLINLKYDTAITAPTSATDGALAANTCVDGLLGPLYRIKWKSAGTYATNTQLTVAVGPRLAPFPNE